MELKEAVDEVEKSVEFINWKKEHTQWYLAHGFMIFEDNEWQVGYTDGEKVITFFLNPVKLMPEQEACKKPDVKIPSLNKANLKLGLDEVMKVIEKIKAEKYSAEQIMKTIILVQNIGEKEVYNITGLTQSLKTVNVKVDMDGKVIEDSCQALVQ